MYLCGWCTNSRASMWDLINVFLEGKDCCRLPWPVSESGGACAFWDKHSLQLPLLASLTSSPPQSLLQIILKRLPFFSAPWGTSPSTGVYVHVEEKMKTPSEKSEHLQGMAAVYVNRQERNVLASHLASSCGMGQFSNMAIQTEHSQVIFWTKGFSFCFKFSFLCEYLDATLIKKNYHVNGKLK